MKAVSGIAVASAAALAVTLIPNTANAAVATISPSAALRSGQSRGIAAAWPDQGPYKVSFVCDVPGCANFTSSRTTIVSVARTISVTTCTGYVANHSVSVTDLADGSSASAQSQTTWSKGTFC